MDDFLTLTNPNKNMQSNQFRTNNFEALAKNCEVTPNERSFSVVNAVKHCRNDRIVNLIIRFNYILLVFHQVLTHSLRLRYVHLSSLRYMFRCASTSSFVLIDFIIYYYCHSLSSSIQINKFQYNLQLNREEINSQM